MDAANPPTVSRREVFRAGAAIAVAGVAATKAQTAHGAAVSLSPGATVLFQGDSITYAGRLFNKQIANDFQGLGCGYALITTAQLMDTYPTLRIQCHNRGISGNAISDLANRWQEDALDLEPDLLSILVGVNDVWYKLSGKSDGTVDSYESGYRELLERTRAALSETTLVVCEPFVFRTGSVGDSWMPEINAHRAAAKRVADEAGAIWVPYQTAFNDAITEANPVEYWSSDGVHPTLAGHALMARTWLDATGLAK